MNEKILKMYFEDKMKQIEIAKELNISKYKVSRVVTKDFRYKLEKEKRKEINKKKHNAQTMQYIAKKRKQRKDGDIAYAQLRQMHIQASRELSGCRKTINNRAFRKWNSSIYNYNKNTKSYHLKSGIITGYDVPKKILWE